MKKYVVLWDCNNNVVRYDARSLTDLLEQIQQDFDVNKIDIEIYQLGKEYKIVYKKPTIVEKED